MDRVVTDYKVKGLDANDYAMEAFVWHSINRYAGFNIASKKQAAIFFFCDPDNERKATPGNICHFSLEAAQNFIFVIDNV